MVFIKVVLTIFVITVVVCVIIKMWTICLPLAIVMICSEAAGLVKGLIRLLTGEPKAKKQHFASSLVELPICAYVVYMLWPVSIILSILYGVVVVVNLVLMLEEILVDA